MGVVVVLVPGENSSFSLTDTHSIVAAIVVVVVYYGL